MTERQHGKPERFVAEALFERMRALRRADSPVGSVLVRDDHVLGRGEIAFTRQKIPRPTRRWKPTATALGVLRATIRLIRCASDLIGADVYTTMMPCEMGAGAIVRFGARRGVVAEGRTYDPAPTSHWLE